MYRHFIWYVQTLDIPLCRHFTSLTPPAGQTNKRKKPKRKEKGKGNKRKKKKKPKRKKPKVANNNKTKKRKPKNKNKQPKTSPPSSGNLSEVIAHDPVKIFLTYKFTPPSGGPSRDTGFLVPGPAWDTVIDQLVWVIHRDPTNHSYLLLDNITFPRRSREHIRACTEREFNSVVNPDTEGPHRVLNQPNVDPFDQSSDNWFLFFRYNKTAGRLRRQKKPNSVHKQRRANSYFKDLVTICDAGFQNLELTKDLVILEPDASKVYNFTDAVASDSASATTTPVRAATSASATSGI